MNKLNAVIIVVLVLFTIFHFSVVDNENTTISELEAEIEIYEIRLDSVASDNIVISNTVINLKDSLFTYKELIKLYNDSLITIKTFYEKESNEVASLNDSSSYVFFVEYIETSAPRFGITFD